MLNPFDPRPIKPRTTMEIRSFADVFPGDDDNWFWQIDADDEDAVILDMQEVFIPPVEEE